MSLEAGTQLGTFEITGQIGVGGMGEVYRATDTKLGREVAIKTLPAALAEDKDRLARFEREAKLLASLNHAHIASVYSLDEHDGTLYIAMELVEGETLEAKLKAGALPIEDALQIGLQIALALEAAHDKGVVHRDLKPANIMVTPDGVVKVLDFGLAKAFSGDPNEATAVNSPALSLAMTQQGLILGTAGYMSPEQASGQATDQRADIWAFGVVLYEMLTGMPVFSGESVPHVLADVLKTDPDWDRLPQNLPWRIRQTLERCLTKKPRNRMHSIADVRFDIESALSAPGQMPAGVIASEGVAPSRRTVLAVGAGAIVAGIGLRHVTDPIFGTAPEPAGVTKWPHKLSEEQTIRMIDVWNALAISPDGRMLVFSTREGLYRRPMDQLEAQLIQGTEGSGVIREVFFNPDNSEEVAFFRSSGDLMRIPVAGGQAALITNIEGRFTGGSWGKDRRILFATENGIFSVGENGTEIQPHVLAEPDQTYRRPQLLPDGDSILVSLTTGAGALSVTDPSRLAAATEIVIVSRATGRLIEPPLLSGGGDAQYVPTGHIVYESSGELYAVTFDPDTTSIGDNRGRLSLEPGVARGLPGAVDFLSRYAVANNGTLAYLASSPRDDSIPWHWVWVNPDGSGRDSIAATEDRRIVYADLSPEGDRLVMVEVITGATPSSNQRLLWTADVEDGILQEAYGPTDDLVVPKWIDENRVIVSVGAGLAMLNLNQDQELQPLSIPGGQGRLRRVSGFTPDRNQMLVEFGETGTGSRIGLVPVDSDANGDNLLEPLFSYSSVDSAQAGQGVIVYLQRQFDRTTLFADRYPELDDRQPISDENGATTPVLVADGDTVTVFYLQERSRAVMRVTLERTESGIEHEAPTHLFDAEDGADLVAVAPDGRLLMSTPPDESEASLPDGATIIVIQGFGDKLKELAPSN